MRYKVDDEIFDDIGEAIEYCISADYHEDDDYFETWVNDTYGSIEIAGDSYYAYDIVDNADDGNMRYLQERYMEAENDNDRENAVYELEHAKVGDEVWCQDCRITVIDDDDGDEEPDSYDIDELRKTIQERNERQKEEDVKTKAEEDHIMSLFQVIK